MFNSAIPCIFYRAEVTNQRDRGQIVQTTAVMAELVDFVEWFLRVVILMITFYQKRLLNSEEGLYCTEEVKLLIIEGKFM